MNVPKHTIQNRAGCFCGIREEQRINNRKMIFEFIFLKNYKSRKQCESRISVLFVYEMKKNSWNWWLTEIWLKLEYRARIFKGHKSERMKKKQQRKKRELILYDEISIENFWLSLTYILCPFKTKTSERKKNSSGLNS